MIAFITEHRDIYGVEPICKVLPIAPVHVPPSCRQTARSVIAAGSHPA